MSVTDYMYRGGKCFCNSCGERIIDLDGSCWRCQVDKQTKKEMKKRTDTILKQTEENIFKALKSLDVLTLLRARAKLEPNMQIIKAKHLKPNECYKGPENFFIVGEEAFVKMELYIHSINGYLTCNKAETVFNVHYRYF